MYNSISRNSLFLIQNGGKKNMIAKLYAERIINKKTTFEQVPNKLKD